jgi:hypothetical protein
MSEWCVVRPEGERYAQALFDEFEAARKKGD